MGCTENEGNNEDDNEVDNGDAKGEGNNTTTIYFDVLPSKGFWINFSVIIDNKEVYHDNYFEEFKEEGEFFVVYKGNITINKDQISIKVTRDNSSCYYEGWYNISEGNYFGIYIYPEDEKHSSDVDIIQKSSPIYYE